MIEKDITQSSADAFDFDIPSTEEEEGGEQLEEALKQNEVLKALTKSRAWGMILAFVEDQKKRRADHIQLTPVTAENMGEQNFMRGEISGLVLLEGYINSLVGDATNVIQLFREQEKLDVDRTERALHD